MIVKAMRAGYYKRYRKAGDTFTFKGDKCPSWAIEIKKGNPATGASKDLKAVDAVNMINTFNDIEALESFIDGDKRASVKEEAALRIAKLEG